MFGMRALRRAAGDFARKPPAGVEASPRQKILLLARLSGIKSMAEIVKSDRNCRVRIVGALTSTADDRIQVRAYHPGVTNRPAPR